MQPKHFAICLTYMQHIRCNNLLILRYKVMGNIGAAKHRLYKEDGSRSEK